MASMVATMPRVKRNDIAVKIDTEVIRKARTITSYRGISLAEYLSEKLRPLVDKDFEAFKKELHRPIGKDD